MQMQADSSSPQSRLTLRIATLVGIGIEILIVGPIPMVIYTNLYRNYYHINTFVVALWEWEVVLALCVTVPVIYSVIISPRLRPKRIVSPITIQVFAIAIIGVISIAIVVPTVVGVSITNVGNYSFVLGISGLVWLLGFAIFGLLGIWQTLVVRWVVGLSEGKPDDATYAVDASFEAVRDQAVKKDFCDFWHLKLQDHKPELVLRRRISEGIGLHANVVLVITPSEDGRTIIHGSAFAEGLYEIIISEYASYCRDCMIDNLVGRLSGKATKALVQDKASLTRISHAFVEASTRSKFTVARARMTGALTALKEIPRIFLFAIVVTLGAWVLVNVLFGILSKANIDIQPIPVIEINVAFLLVTVGEIIVPAWEPIRQGNRIQPSVHSPVLS